MSIARIQSCYKNAYQKFIVAGKRPVKDALLMKSRVFGSLQLRLRNSQISRYDFRDSRSNHEAGHLRRHTEVQMNIHARQSAKCAPLLTKASRLRELRRAAKG